MPRRTAKERGTVTYVSNLFDTFFPRGKDHRMPRPSATHMPYLEGAILHHTVGRTTGTLLDTVCHILTQPVLFTVCCQHHALLLHQGSQHPELESFDSNSGL